MKITELITELTKIYREHGDLDVETVRGWEQRVPVKRPTLAYRANLKHGERVPRFFDFYLYQSDAQERKGEPVCRI